MISRIEGRLRRTRRDEQVVEVDVGGIWYEIKVPFFVWRSLDERPEDQDSIELEIFYYATERQPKPMLVGFQRDVEREFFKKFIQVEDIGPTKAVEALSMSISTIARAIENGDNLTLRKLKGIGERTADKIIATLRGKVTREALLSDEGYREAAGVDIPSDVRNDAVEALVQLGYKKGDALQWVEQVSASDKDKVSVEDLLKGVFQALQHA
jgi:Holliday junction DNA helicase RuvA